MTCDKCGAELQVGDFPFCKGNRADHGPMRQAIQTNEQFIGGLTIENMGTTPVTVYSREEFKEQMARHNVEQKIKYVPGDKYLTNWAAGIDAQTLENARVLLSRRGPSLAGKYEKFGELQSLQTSIRVLPSKES